MGSEKKETPTRGARARGLSLSIILAPSHAAAPGGPRHRRTSLKFTSGCDSRASGVRSVRRCGALQSWSGWIQVPVQRGTRGGRRRLKTVERCGRRCCNNRLLLTDTGFCSACRSTKARLDNAMFGEGLVLVTSGDISCFRQSGSGCRDSEGVTAGVQAGGAE
ncbi:hypothetical protein EYF80_008489 [Liparis tanakae]|uniref:Uncharacterized protein n=1 Tax=Liparis tanakae TaxID=230148 RepID=A0A4Z2ITC5_9TELE|nr:hypothetical protein EYF80_008489 [Liparis tanakae]